MLHPCTEVRFINAIIGHGVFSTTCLPQGTILWVRDDLDQEFTPQQVNQMQENVRETMLTYSYRNARGNYIFCWDNTRYINHSFHANCMTTPYGFEIAVREIKPGDQITNDYGTLNIIEPFEPCPEGSSRTTVFPDDIARHHQEYDMLINQSIDKINTIEQPLKKFFTAEAWKLVQQLVNNNAPRRSIVECLLK